MGESVGLATIGQRINENRFESGLVELIVIEYKYVRTNVNNFIIIFRLNENINLSDLTLRILNNCFSPTGTVLNENYFLLFS